MTASVTKTLEILENAIPEDARRPGWRNDGIAPGIAIPDEPKIIKPWQTVTNDDIREILQDTILGDLCGYYASATRPPLPLEVAILKAIVSAACALSEKGEKSVDPRLGNIYGVNARGNQLARLCVNTAGGQVCNAYAMTVGNSASGKDIGDLLGTAMEHYGWNLGTSGSAEGIVDALIKIPNGLQSISEMMNWLDPKHYLYRASSVFTELFSKGYFKYNMSVRSNAASRESDYAYPCIYANIQPDVFDEYVKKVDVTSGFLGRFLMTRMPIFLGRPRKFDPVQVIGGIIVCLDMFRGKTGIVDVPEDYLDATSQMFAKESPIKLIPSWRRLVNEYSPRFAVMLSITHDPATQTREVILTDRCWNGAEKLVLWFFAHAEKLLGKIENLSMQAKERENIIARILNVIKKRMPDGARWTDISNYASYGTTKTLRAEALEEMEDRGWIRRLGDKTIWDKGHMLSVGERYFVHRLPPAIAAMDGE